MPNQAKETARPSETWKIEEHFTIEDVLKFKTLAEWCKFFGWQGGTIHEAKEALTTFLSLRGICARKEDGVLCGLSINQASK